MVEHHVVINEAPPTNDDEGEAGSGSGCSVGTAGHGVGRLYRSIQGT